VLLLIAALLMLVLGLWAADELEVFLVNRWDEER
jgi:hypothetical protein